MNLKKLTLAALAIMFVLSTTSTSEARRKHRRHSRKSKKRAVINEPDLYQRIGGSKAVSDLVDDWVKSALADGRLTGSFGSEPVKPSTITKLRKDLVAEVCELSDGPCKAADAKKLPEAFSLPNEKFVVLADHLVHSMDKMHIREREKNELLGRIGEVRTDGPTDASDFDDDDDT